MIMSEEINIGQTVNELAAKLGLTTLTFMQTVNDETMEQYIKKGEEIPDELSRRNEIFGDAIKELKKLEADGSK